MKKAVVLLSAFLVLGVITGGCLGRQGTGVQLSGDINYDGDSAKQINDIQISPEEDNDNVSLGKLVEANPPEFTGDIPNAGTDATEGLQVSPDENNENINLGPLS